MDLATLSIALYQLTRDRQIKLPLKFKSDDFISLLTYLYVTENQPNSHEEALIKYKDSAKWLATI